MALLLIVMQTALQVQPQPFTVEAVAIGHLLPGQLTLLKRALVARDTIQMGLIPLLQIVIRAVLIHLPLLYIVTHVPQESLRQERPTLQKLALTALPILRTDHIAPAQIVALAEGHVGIKELIILPQ